MIVFHHLGNDVPPWLEPGMKWTASYYVDQCPFPTAIAWLTVDQPSGTALLEFIITNDEARRQGIATQLIQGCRERWPNLFLSAPVSESGKGWIRSLGWDNCIV